MPVAGLNKDVVLSEESPIATQPQVLVGLALALSMVSAEALCRPSDPYKISAYEKAACATDAMRLCADTYPDVQQLLVCMKTNRASLNSICQVAFDAGLKRRHLE